MKRYIGTKIINATPMSRGEYNRYISEDWMVVE